MFKKHTYGQETSLLTSRGPFLVFDGLVVVVRKETAVLVLMLAAIIVALASWHGSLNH
jgi:hypothetical protein